MNPSPLLHCGGPVYNRLVISFPRTCVYRWAPDKWARTQTEPAPSELLKATGMQPYTERAEPAVWVPMRVTGPGQGAYAVLTRLLRRRFPSRIGSNDRLRAETIISERPESSHLGPVSRNRSFERPKRSFREVRVAGSSRGG